MFTVHWLLTCFPLFVWSSMVSFGWSLEEVLNVHVTTYFILDTQFVNRKIIDDQRPLFPLFVSLAFLPVQNILNRINMDEQIELGIMLTNVRYKSVYSNYFY